MNTKTRRLQPITNNNYRTHTPVDSFVQLNLKPSSIDIKLEDYKKVNKYVFCYYLFSRSSSSVSRFYLAVLPIYRQSHTRSRESRLYII